MRHIGFSSPLLKNPSSNTDFWLDKVKAFTLAEVLIVLTIIGVVASMTIPALMNKTNDAELKNAWKNDYAIINQAFQRAKNDNGGDMEEYLTNGGTLAGVFKQYFINIKYCGGSSYDAATYSVSPCFSRPIAELNGSIVGGAGLSPVIFDDGGFILQNGATIVLENYSTDDNYNGIYYAYIWVDVNGWKKPNTIGKDIFGVVVLKDRLIPMGAPVPGIPNGSLNYLPGETTCNSSTSGIACSALYLKQ